jgi:transcriptional regulator with XRE-family HTH domain
MDINKSINHFMYELHLNQRQLAVEAGMSVSSLSLIRNNRRSPTIKTLAKLASACEVKVSEFIAVGE